MNRVTVSIGGLDYAVACEPGDETRIRDLAAAFDEIVQGMKVKVGEIGDRRIAVMAGLSVLDRLRAAEAQNARLGQRVAALERAREAAALAAETDDETLVQRLEETAAAIDAVTSLINRDTRNRTRAGERKVVPTVDVPSRRKPQDVPADQPAADEGADPPPAPVADDAVPAPQDDGPADSAGAIVPGKDRRPG